MQATQDIDHTIAVYGKKFTLGQTMKGEFQDPPATYFGEAVDVGDNYAVVKIISHTKGSQFRTGERVRFIFKK